ncbi:MAG: hypothetical protein WC479_12570, partial [Candidatus Izemoplasmatales bacterium]
LDKRGDRTQAMLFRKAADTMEAQLGQPEPGQGSNPMEQARVMEQRKAGAPGEVATVPSNVASPEAIGGFTPAQLRQSIGRGKVQVRR